MKYFELALVTTIDEIKAGSTINLREYGYLSPMASLNEYLCKTLNVGCLFFVYRETTEGLILSAFAYDERKHTYEEAYQYVLDVLRDVFAIRKVLSDPNEITMFRFFEYLQEARRREFINFSPSLLDTTNLFMGGRYIGNVESFGYELSETVIAPSDEKPVALYDPAFQEELSNIANHKNASPFRGNMVHYVLSYRSFEAAYDMTEKLVQHLADANRLTSRRVEIIRDMEPDLFRKQNYLETIIENNCGGTVLFDLNEKFGYNPADYTMTCQYLEKLVKQYRNDCLFIFSYPIENTGFSYFLLPQLKQYLLPVFLREGSGNRADAAAYLARLIRHSDYAAYTHQAAEFLDRFPGDVFTQTDILQAYEQFVPWCLSKNVLKTYDYNVSDDFLLDRDAPEVSAYDTLQKMIGLAPVKQQIEDIIATNAMEKERKKRLGNAYRTGSMHMVFAGNPGTAKTTVAHLFAALAKDRGILKSGAFVEQGGMDLDGLGCVSRIRDAFTAAKGGVLFIDEAYSLQSSTAITVLLQEMENRREDVIVILAGYHERMMEFIQRNEGLQSRIPHWIHFADYTTAELTDIFRLMLAEKRLHTTEDGIQEARYIFEKARHQENFGNGRFVRNLIEKAVQKQSLRLLSHETDTTTIGDDDLFLLTAEDIRQWDGEPIRSVGSAQRELDEMIGLANVKAIIHKAKAGFALRKYCLDHGLRKDNASLHMVFTGNPGTAKTTVARLFAEILKDENVLPTGNFVEVGRGDLVGDHVGATALLVKRRFREAAGGVLFIDEAYSLCDGYDNGFGDEAITTIVQEMENHRDNVIVIFAGYPLPMKRFLSRNPGLSSRIAFHVDFDDYTVDELCDIATRMLAKKNMSITEAAMAILRQHCESAKGSLDFGNGRFVRKLLEEAEMNLAERLLKLNVSELTEPMVTTIEEEDIPDVPSQEKAKQKIPLGFTVPV